VLSKLLIAWCLMALCVTIHVMGLMSAFRWMKQRASVIEGNFWPATWMLILTAGWTLLLHLLQIAVWAFYYAWSGAMPDLESGFYFSSVTYTTTGYGDLVLPAAWRLVGGVEALTGILMCGLSTGMFFAFFSRILAIHAEPNKDRNE
jgi:Ion channel